MSEFESTLDKLAEYVITIGDEIVDKDVEDLFSYNYQGQDYTFQGHRCSSDGDIYLVAGHPDFEHTVVIYFFSIARTAGDRLDEGTMEVLLEDDIGSYDSPSYAAGELLLDDVPRGDMEAFINYIFMFTSSGDHETHIQRNDAGSFVGFYTAKLIFPSEDKFGISDFYESVQSVLSSAERGNRMVSRSIFVNEDQDEPRNTEIEVSFNW